MSGWDMGLDRFDRFHAIYPHDRYNLSSSGGVLASFNVSRADEIVPPPGTWACLLPAGASPDGRHQSYKADRRRGYETLPLCRSNSSYDDPFLVKKSKYWSFGNTCRHTVGAIPGSIREIIDTRVMLLWQRRDRVVQERKIKGESYRPFVTISFWYLTIDIFD